MSITLTKGRLFLFFGVWFAAFLFLAYAGDASPILRVILGSLFLLFVPGALTILAFRLKGFAGWMYLPLALALSLLTLMTLGLLGNALLPAFGIERPLERVYLIPEIAALTLALGLVAWRNTEAIRIPFRRVRLFETPRDLAYALAPLPLIPMVIGGAMELNQGGEGGLALVALLGMVLYSALLIKNAPTLGRNVLPTGLFFLSCGLLLMTSLRGFHITGHDIQLEYKVFEFTRNTGIWSIAAFRDTYNACISITILPTIFANTLVIASEWIFKALFQIIFAFSAGIVYFVSRRLLSARLALLAGLYFIAFPTFFEDMPFLIRQEIAFLFFGLMIYVLFEERLALRRRQTLFFALGIGVILSHYSTVYTVIAILMLVLLLRPLLRGFLTWAARRKSLAHSALLPAEQQTSSERKIPAGIVLALAALAFGWTFLVTGTEGHLTKVARDVASTIERGFTENSRSLDAVSLITFGKASEEETLEEYMREVVLPARASAPPGVFYDETTYQAYSFKPAKELAVPPTKAGLWLRERGIDAASVLPLLGQTIAKLMEVAAVVGVIYVTFRRSVTRSLNSEYYLLAWSCLIFIATSIVVPVLSTEYGVFRALQQSLFVLAPLLVAGTLAVGMALVRLARRSARPFARGREGAPARAPEVFAAALAVLFFAYSTTLLPQLFGGNPPALHLNNRGFYYDHYLMHGAERSGIERLLALAREAAERRIPFDLYADRYAQQKIASLTNLEFSGDPFPGIVTQGAYVFLDVANIEKEEAALRYQGNLIVYRYPLSFLDNTKSLVYTNGSVRIYR